MNFAEIETRMDSPWEFYNGEQLGLVDEGINDLMEVYDLIGSFGNFELWESIRGSKRKDVKEESVFERIKNINIVNGRLLKTIADRLVGLRVSFMCKKGLWRSVMLAQWMKSKNVKVVDNSSGNYGGRQFGISEIKDKDMGSRLFNPINDEVALGANIESSQMLMVCFNPFKDKDSYENWSYLKKVVSDNQDHLRQAGFKIWMLLATEEMLKEAILSCEGKNRWSELELPPVGNLEW